MIGYSKDKKSHADDKLHLSTMLALKKGDAPMLPVWLEDLTTTRMTTIRDHLRAERSLTPTTLNKYLSGAVRDLEIRPPNREGRRGAGHSPTLKRR